MQLLFFPILCHLSSAVIHSEPENLVPTSVSVTHARGLFHFIEKPGQKVHFMKLETETGARFKIQKEEESIETYPR